MANIKKIDRKNERERADKPNKTQYVAGKNRKSKHNKPDVAGYTRPNVPQGAVKAARIAQKVGSESLKQSRLISKSSDRQGDQEAAEQYESFVVNRVEGACAGTAQKSADLIRKKTRDIKNTRDVKSNVRTIRKADTTVRTSVKAAEYARKTADETAKQAVITTEKIALAKRTEQVAKKSAEWIKKIVKGIIESLKAFLETLCAASVPLVLVLIIAGMIAAIVASSFGIFFVGSSLSGGDTESTPTLQDVVLAINQEYTDEIESIKTANPHDELVVVGGRSAWQDVLAIYAVSVTTDPENPMDVVTMTDDRIEILRNLFWEMNTITYEIEEVTETASVQSVDEEGNPMTDDDGNPIMEEQETVTTVLHITVSHLSAWDEASNLGFSDSQNAQLVELLDARYASLWIQILRGVGLGSDELVTLALSQIGNEGGEKYWRWAGRDTRCPWCALFVSWCADQTGLLASGKIPYFSFVTDGVEWFQANDKWIDGSSVDSSNYDQIVYPGMLIFFDWGPQDGIPDHVGIVTNVVNGFIYTIEGNNGDAVAESYYAADSSSVFGYGVID